MTSGEFDQQHIWHPYNTPPGPGSPSNHVITKANGVTLTLANGATMIDAMSSWWCKIHGYNHPDINRAIRNQLKQMAHVMFGGLTHQPAIELSKKLLAIVPQTMQHIFYADSGSVAVEVALKMAVQYQQALGKNKQRFLTIRGGYHGDTWKAMSVCDPVTGLHRLFRHGIHAEFFVDRPPIKITDDWDSNPQSNGLQAVQDTLDEHADSIAALILEPIMQGAGGLYFYHPQYLNQCRELCKHYDVLLIFDEIATGFGRTGKLFAVEHCAIEPDILCLGKALTGGYLSFAATLCSDKIAEGINAGDPAVLMHGPTFMANPLACSAAIANLVLLADMRWQQQVRQIETQLKQELHAAHDITGVIDVRVLGAVGVIELDHVVNVHQSQSLCPDLGVWLRPFNNMIYCMPPYIVNQSELSQITQAMLVLAETL